MKLSFLFRNRDFAAVYTGRLFSLAGARAYQIATFWWIMSRPAVFVGHGTEIAFVMIMDVLPALLFGKWIGAYIEHAWPVKLMIHVQFAASLFMLLAWWALWQGFVGVGLLGVVAFGLAFGEALLAPAIDKVTPELVEKAERQTAITFMSSNAALASTAGVVIGAILIDRVGVTGIFFANAVCALTSFLLALAVRKDCDPLAHGQKTLAQTEIDVLLEAKESGLLSHLGTSSEETSGKGSSFAFLQYYQVVVKVLIGFAVVGFLTQPVLLLLPPYVKSWSSGSASELAWLEGAIWFGLFLGNFFAQRIPVLIDVFQVAIATQGICGACLVALWLWPRFSISLIALFGVGFSLGITHVRSLVYFHETIQEELKGRFFAILQSVNAWSFPLGFLVFGTLVDRVPVGNLFLAQGVTLGLAIGIYFFFISNSVHRRRGRLA